MDLAETLQKVSQETENKWRIRKREPALHTQEERRRVKELPTKISWANIHLWNLFYARCPTHNDQLLNFKHLK